MILPPLSPGLPLTSIPGLPVLTCQAYSCQQGGAGAGVAGVMWRRGTTAHFRDVPETLLGPSCHSASFPGICQEGGG